jgi:hypothetical protein
MFTVAVLLLLQNAPPPGAVPLPPGVVPARGEPAWYVPLPKNAPPAGIREEPPQRERRHQPCEVR